MKHKLYVRQVPWYNVLKMKHTKRTSVYFYHLLLQLDYLQLSGFRGQASESYKIGCSKQQPSWYQGSVGTCSGQFYHEHHHTEISSHIRLRVALRQVIGAVPVPVSHRTLSKESDHTKLTLLPTHYIKWQAFTSMDHLLPREKEWPSKCAV